MQLKIKLTKENIYLIFFWSVILFIFFKIVRNRQEKFDILRKHNYTATCKVYETLFRPKRSWTNIKVYYKFKAKQNNTEIEISGSSIQQIDRNLDSFLIGNYFTVVYLPEDPETNYILIFNNDYGFFNFTQPDSLKWLNIYEKKASLYGYVK
jgi:hypothetical protein